MKNLYIEKTKSTPLIDFNYETGILKIEGKSFPENASEFYQPINIWVQDFLKEDNFKMVINLDIIYLNTSTTKIIMGIFDNLDKHYKNGKDIIINWYYDNENEMSLESGEEFKEDLTIPFNIIVKSK